MNNSNNECQFSLSKLEIKKKKIKGDQSIGRSVGRLEKSIVSNVNIIACANFCQEIHARRGGICNFIAWMKLVPNLSSVGK